MAMYATSQFYEQGFNFVINNCNRIAVNSTRPTTYAEAINTASCTTSLAAVVSSAIGSTWFTVSTGDQADSGAYKLNIAASSAMQVVCPLTVDHISLLNATSSKVLYVTTCNSRALTTGDTVTVPTWDIEIAGPTSS